MKIGDLIYQGKKISELVKEMDCKDTNCQKCHISDICGIDDYEEIEVELPSIIKAADMADLDKRDNVNHPSHYQGKHECIDIMLAMFGKEAVKGFCMCNAYKYRFRAYKKNGVEDIKKAEWYENKLIELSGDVLNG